MSVKLEIRKEDYVIVSGDKEIVLTEDELRNLNRQIDEIWFERDVKNYIEEKKLIFNEDTVEDIVSEYCHLRHKNDGDSEGMTWDECLDEAFKGHEYGDKLNDEMWSQLKEKFMDDERLAAEFLGVTTGKVLSMSKEELSAALDHDRIEREDELVEWYEETVE